MGRIKTIKKRLILTLHIFVFLQHKLTILTIYETFLGSRTLKKDSQTVILKPTRPTLVGLGIFIFICQKIKYQ